MSNELEKIALVNIENRIQRIINDYPGFMLGRNVLDALHNVLDCIDQERELL